MKVDLSRAKPGAVVAELIPPPSTPEDLARYAEASGDMNPLHLDPAFARKAGFDRQVVHGMLGMAHMGRLLSNHFSATAIRSFNARFAAVVLVGERVRYRAILAERNNGSCKLSLAAITESGVTAISGEAVIDMQLIGNAGQL